MELSEIGTLLKVRKNDSLAERCLSALHDETALIDRGISSASGQSLYEIYKVRASFPEAMNGAIDGLDSLLAGLEAASQTGATIDYLDIRTPTDWFLVFTEEKTKQIVGILAGRIK